MTPQTLPAWKKNNLKLRKGRASPGNQRGQQQHPRDTGTCCSASPVPRTRPPRSPRPPSPPSQPGQAARRPCSGFSTQRAGPEQWSRPAPPRHAATPASATTGTAGTGAQPGWGRGWWRKGPLCWHRIDVGDTRPPKPPHHCVPLPLNPFLPQFQQPLMQHPPPAHSQPLPARGVQ